MIVIIIYNTEFVNDTNLDTIIRKVYKRGKLGLLLSVIYLLIGVKYPLLSLRIVPIYYFSFNWLIVYSLDLEPTFR